MERPPTQDACPHNIADGIAKGFATMSITGRELERLQARSRQAREAIELPATWGQMRKLPKTGENRLATKPQVQRTQGEPTCHTSETELVRACLKLLAARRIFAWRCNSGGMKKGNHFIRFGMTGMSDILGIMSDGRFLAIECKVGRNKPTPDQGIFLAEIHDRGGVALVVYSLDELERFLASEANNGRQTV